MPCTWNVHGGECVIGGHIGHWSLIFDVWLLGGHGDKVRGDARHSVDARVVEAYGQSAFSMLTTLVPVG